MKHEIILELREVTKRYPGTLAVDQVNLTVRRGEVHALMGENGAGKSTLMKILAGSFSDYTGDIFVDGHKARMFSPSLAKSHGVEMIYQELSLAGPLSVAENILVGRLPRRGLFLDRRAMECEARRCLAQVGLEIDPFQPVDMLSQHEAQLVEIAKALGNDPAILVMDEPTSALSRAEVKRLFTLMEQLKQQGVTIIYISHHLSEVYSIADRITVMRDGRKIATTTTEEVDPLALVEMMIGQPAVQTGVRRQGKPGKKRLRVRNLSRWGFFHQVRFHVRTGEIVGIGGLAGAGRTELARVLSGIDPCDSGEVLLDGRLVDLRSMRRTLRQGVAYLTEDRKLQGLALQLTAQSNLLASLHVKRGCLLGRRRQRSCFNDQASQLQLSPRQPHRSVGQFSGGNQQKILLGKWLATDPEVLILDEPTRGVDVGAKQIIHETIVRLADTGMCVLLISSDLPELVTLSDRVLIMRKGRLTAEIGKDRLAENTVLLAASTDAQEPAHG